MTNDKLSKALAAFIAFLMIGFSGVTLAGCNNTDSKDNDDTSQHGDNGDTDGDVIDDPTIIELPTESKYYDYFRYDMTDPNNPMPLLGDELYYVLTYEAAEGEYSILTSYKEDELKQLFVTAEMANKLLNLTPEDKKTLEDMGFKGEFTIDLDNCVYVPDKYDSVLIWYVNGHPNGPSIPAYYDAKDADADIKNLEVTAVKNFKNFKDGTLMDCATLWVKDYKTISIKEYENSTVLGTGLDDNEKTNANSALEKISTSHTDTNIKHVTGSFSRQNVSTEYRKKFHS